mgnify:FL=1
MSENNSVSEPAKHGSPSLKESALTCMWEGCGVSCENAEVLYLHLCDDHVGRISKNNLCLTCYWDGCGASYGKRDHITSHIRIHTPLKPFSCTICGKSFKRSQDLKKHGRTHISSSSSAAEKGAREALSKSPDEFRPSSGYGPSLPPPLPPFRAMSSPSELTENMPTPAFSSQSSRDSSSPTSSPNAFRPLEGGPMYPRLSMHSNLPSSSTMYPSLARLAPEDEASHFPSTYEEPASLDMTHAMRNGSFSGGESLKRPRSSIDNFWDDVQRKKLAPTYDTGMMERLDQFWLPDSHTIGDLDAFLNESMNAINYGMSTTDQRSAPGPSTMPPLNGDHQQISDINAWLLQLGDSMSRPPAGTSMMPTNFAQSLSLLGLTNIPGAEAISLSSNSPTNVSSGAADYQQYPWTTPTSTIPSQEKGLYPVYRQVQPLTRAPPCASAMDEDDGVRSSPVAASSSCSTVQPPTCLRTRNPSHCNMYPNILSPARDSSSSSTPRHLAKDVRIRERHMKLVLNLLMALNKNKCIHPGTGNVVTIGRMPARRRSDGRPWPSLALSTPSSASSPPFSGVPTSTASTGIASSASCTRRLMSCSKSQHRVLPPPHSLSPCIRSHRESQTGALPSIAQLLSDVNMD